jgi:hypothetical protein
MTWNFYSVSPKPSVRLKPGTNLPGLRPSASGDTAAPVAQISPSASTEDVCLFRSAPSGAFALGHFHRPSCANSLNHVLQRTLITRALSLVICFVICALDICHFPRPSHPHSPLCTLHSALISPLLYRTFSRCTAKPSFSFSLFFVPLCLCVRNAKSIFFPMSLRRPACAESPRSFLGN